MYLRTHLLTYQCNQLNNAEGEGDQNDEVTWSWLHILLKLKWSDHVKVSCTLYLDLKKYDTYAVINMFLLVPVLLN